MGQTKPVEEIYRTGYDAFEGGDYAEAKRLADACLGASTPADYWYAGALGLKCWVASFIGDGSTLQESAERLSTMDTGEDTHWFDGLAALHLGFLHYKESNHQKAKELFSQASLSYRQQTLLPGQPPEWQYVLDYFSTLAAWLAEQSPHPWQQYNQQLTKDCAPANQLCLQLKAAANLMIKYTQGESTAQEAADLLKMGVSRTFLCPILLNYPPNAQS